MTSTVQGGGHSATHRWRSIGTAYVPPVQAPSHRSFGLTVGGVLAGIAALSIWRGHALRAEVAGIAAALLIVLALVRPASLARPAQLWADVGHALGWFNSRVLLTLIFVFLFVPIGLVARLFGKDPLDRRKPGSRWYPYTARVRSPQHFEHPF